MLISTYEIRAWPIWAISLDVTCFLIRPTWFFDLATWLLG